MTSRPSNVLQPKDLITSLRDKTPRLIYLNGKTGTGKTTLAGRLGGDLGYTRIELDQCVHHGLIEPLGLTDHDAAFRAAIGNDGPRDWIDHFIATVRAAISVALSQGGRAVVDGSLDDVDMLARLLTGHPDTQLLYIHPYSLSAYRRNLLARLQQANVDNDAGLPSSFWDQIDQGEFAKFCETRQPSAAILAGIGRYAERSQQESSARLRRFQRRFTFQVLDIDDAPSA